MENPYQILRRFIKWEMMDLEAMAETIESKNEFNKRRHLVQNRMSSNCKELTRIQKGQGIFNSFVSKSK
jgi:rhamnogalacturonyl hydrolase YesR